MEEKYRWIKANFYGNGEEIFVRQSEADRSVFFDADGHAYNIDELDFTQISEQPSFIAEMNERMRKSDEEHERTQKQLREMLAAMDSRAIADHQAEIDERAYWMKLRGEIFMKILERGGDFTKESELDWATRQARRIFDTIYSLHQEFVTTTHD